MINESVVEKFVNALDLLPSYVAKAEEQLDGAREAFYQLLYEKQIEALGQPMFFDKKAERGLRPPSNDDERNIALKSVAYTDTELVRLRRTMEEKERNLRYLHNQLQTYEIAAKLLGSK